jgi:cobalt/nickel transport system ATP-binding protein
MSEHADARPTARQSTAPQPQTAPREAPTGPTARGGDSVPAFRLAEVRQSYRSGVESLSGITLQIASGEHVAIVGANGSGKSTLLKLLDGLVFPSAGTVEVFGKALTEESVEEPQFRAEFRSRVGFVFQDADVQLFCSNVLDELAFGPLQLGLDEARVRERVDEVARGLRLEKLLDRAPYTLSGGEKQRVAIGAVLAMRPDVLLMDEPASALDPRSQVWLLEVISSMKRDGRTVVIATHDLGSAAEFADRMVVLSEEHRISADGTPAEVLGQRDLLLEVNLIHEHAHAHGSELHRHPHAHGHSHEAE